MLILQLVLWMILDFTMPVYFSWNTVSTPGDWVVYLTAIIGAMTISTPSWVISVSQITLKGLHHFNLMNKKCLFTKCKLKVFVIHVFKWILSSFWICEWHAVLARTTQLYQPRSGGIGKSYSSHRNRTPAEFDSGSATKHIRLEPTSTITHKVLSLASVYTGYFGMLLKTAF